MRAVGAALLAVAFLASCGGGYDGESFYLCFDGPQFETEALPAATVGQQYSALVTAEIVRNPYDDTYKYSFTIDGHVPTGLQVLMPNQERRLQFIGVPQTAGTYTFTVSVSVWERNGTRASLCWDTSDRTYQIVVAPSPSGNESAP